MATFLSHDGQQPEFEGFKQTDTYEELFNLRIADFHTDFVGGDDWGFSVRTHNSYAEPYYGSSDLSHEAQIERMLRPETYPGQNVAVFEYERGAVCSGKRTWRVTCRKSTFWSTRKHVWLGIRPVENQSDL